MKKQLFFHIFLFLSALTFAQKQEPRLVLPVGHTNWINSISIDSSENYVLSSSRDNTIKLWEISSGMEVQSYSQSNSITKAIFYNQDKEIISSSKDSEIVVWDKTTGNKKAILTEHSEAVNDFLVYSNKLISIGDDSLLIRWNLNNYSIDTRTKLKFTPKVIKQIDETNFLIQGESNSICFYNSFNSNLIFKSFLNEEKIFSIDVLDSSKLLVIFQEGKVKCYNWKSDVCEFEVLTKDSQIYSSLIIPNKSIFITSGNDNHLKIWSLKNADLVRIINSGHDGQIIVMSVAPDNSYFLTGSKDQTIKAWNLDSLELLNTFFGHKGRVSHLTFGKNPNIFFSVSRDKSIISWEVKNNSYSKRFQGYTIRMNNIDFSSSNELFLLSGRDSIIRIFDTKSGKIKKLLSGHKSNVLHAEFNYGSNKIISAGSDNSVIFWDVDKEKIINVYKGHNHYVNYATISKNDSIIVSCSDDSSVIIWNQKSSELIKRVKFPFRVLKTIFSRDDSEFLIFGKTNFVYKYSIKELCIIDTLQASKEIVLASALSQNGQFFITSGVDKVIRIWHYSDFKLIREIKLHKDYVWALAISNDDNWIYSGGDDDVIFRTSLIDSTFFKLIGHDGLVLSIKTSQDDKFLVSCGGDHRTIFWNLSDCKKSHTILNLNNNNWVYYDSDFRFDASKEALDKIAISCDLVVNVIDLSQVKDSLWVPGLVEKIMNGDSILINDRPAPKLKDLNICDLTPIIEPIDKGDKGLYRYKIIPRNGGLGETEVYINGNLTYKFKPEQLQKKLEQKKEVYYLTFSSDTLQGFLTGEKNNANPILVKAKVKGSGIYGRGVVLDVVKTTEKENPKFYGVFIGVNDYGNPTKESSAQRYRDLDFAKKDADDLSNAVEATARNLFKEDCRIYRLTGTGNSDSVPSKANLQNVLKEIGENAKASDILYIFFAGHGDISEKSGEKEIRFILHKADKKNVMSTSFGVEELTEWCHPKNIKAQKRVLVFDACHSGQIINQTMAFNGRGDDEATRIRQLDRLKDKNGMMILAAAADNESAYEDETLNQGVLTYHLLQVMKEQPKDTSLEIRSWFDETIDLVKDYSRANGNQQEPNSFGDGRFEIGNITNEVRQSIDISCPKTRIGMCDITMNPEAKVMYPQLRQKINEFFISSSSRGELVYSKNLEKSYRIVASCNVRKKKAEIYFDVFIGETQLSEAISLPATKGQTEEELVAQLAQSITAEIERLDKRDEKCKSKKK
jgi:WD40 repeat protein